MAMTIPDAPEVVTPGDLGDLLASFTRSMRANNVSPNTVLAYGGAVRQFAHWLMDRGYPTDVSKIEARHIQEWIGSILETSKPATAHNRFRGLQRVHELVRHQGRRLHVADEEAPPAPAAEAH